MNITDYIKTLDDIPAPVIILDSQGKVICKNITARKQIRLPRRNTHIFAHLDRASKNEYSKIAERSRPSLITVNTGDRNARAFVWKYQRPKSANIAAKSEYWKRVRNERFENSQIEMCSVLVFVPQFQANASSRAFNRIENGIAAASLQICEIVKEIDMMEYAHIKDMPSQSITRINKRVKNALDKIYCESRESCDTIYYSLRKTLDIVASSTTETFSKFGYNVVFTNKNIDKDHEALIDYITLSTVYTHLLQFSVVATKGRSIKVQNTYDKDKYCLEMIFTVPIPPVYAENECDLSKLASLCPKKSLDIVIVERLCESFKLNLSFGIYMSAYDNVRIKLEMPVSKCNIVCAPNEFDIENILLAKDQTAVMAFLASMTFCNNDIDEE